VSPGPNDDAVLWLHSVILALGAGCLVAYPFQPQLPLLVHFGGLVFDFLEHGEGEFELRWGHSRKEDFHDFIVEGAGHHRPAARSAVQALGTLI
jgi:hypothetical protein